MKATFLKGMLIAIIFVNLMVFLQGAIKPIDFAVFYRASLLVHCGQLHHLYDKATQQRFPGFSGTYFYHPVFEMPVFFPLAWFSQKIAYALWSLGTACLIGLSCWILSKDITLPIHPALLAFSFFPALTVFAIGQDSAWLLLLLVLTYRYWTRNQNALCGMFLACALIKFQYAIPLAFFLLIRRRSKSLAAGFFVTAAVLVFGSWLIIGDSGFLDYWHLLRDHDLQLQERMVNIRGLVGMRSEHPALAIALSCVAMVWLLYRSKNSGELNYFGAAVAIAFLVSYHGQNYDALILLIPLLLALADRWLMAWVFWVEPLYVVLAMFGLLSLFAIPTGALAWHLTRESESVNRDNPAGVSTSEARESVVGRRSADRLVENETSVRSV